MTTMVDEFGMPGCAPLLRSTLEVAVPLWIEQLRPLTWHERADRAELCGQYVAEHGDVIMYRGARQGDTAAAFNRLAEGLACLAFVPGGVKFMGMHWEVPHQFTPQWYRKMRRVVWRKIRRLLTQEGSECAGS